MPFPIPPAQATMNPFLQAVSAYLNKYSGWPWRYLPWNRHRAHVSEVAELVADIRAGRASIIQVISRLEHDPLAQNAELQTFVDEIRAGLFAYLSSTNTEGKNTLMLTACDEPDAVEPVLTAISSLSTDAQFSVLNNTASIQSGHALIDSTLSYATPTRVLCMLIRAMDPLTPEQRFHILAKTHSENGYNHGFHTLMLVVLYDFNALGPLLETINTLTQEQQFTILSHRGSRGSDALIEGARHRPATVPLLVDAINRLRSEEHKRIIFNHMFQAMNAHERAPGFNNTEAAPLIRRAMEALGLLTAAPAPAAPINEAGGDATSSGLSGSVFFQSPISEKSALIEKLRDITALCNWRLSVNPLKIWVQSDRPETFDDATAKLVELGVMNVSVKYIRKPNQFRLTCSDIDEEALLAAPVPQSLHSDTIPILR